MKVPIFNTDPDVLRIIGRIIDQSNSATLSRKRRSGDDTLLQATPIGTYDAAIEYINYHMPAVILINFSDPHIDGFQIMERINADPWMNHGGIIAVYNSTKTLDAINALENTNIVISLSHGNVESLLPNVLRIVKSNRQVLVQRAIQTDLLTSISGRFTLGMDILLVPCYANLISNYLYNVGFVSQETKHDVALVLTEMLTNAIEHGNCGICSEDKVASLERAESLRTLIEEKCKDPRIARRKVNFTYEISRSESAYVISDEGPGFDWHAYLDEHREIDYLAEHGRGIMLAQRVADRLAYNDSGNEVTLTFKHNEHASNMVPVVFMDNEIVECHPGDVIFRQGEESTFLYYVAEGLYRVEVDGQHVANITPDDILLGEMSFLLEETRSATVIADTSGRLIKISKESFINIIKNQPYYGLFLSKLLAQRLHRASRGLVS